MSYVITILIIIAPTLLWFLWYRHITRKERKSNMRKKDRNLIEISLNELQGTFEHNLRQTQESNISREAINKEIAEKQIEAQNRVNLSLEKYNQLKEEIDSLKERNENITADLNHCIAILTKLNIPTNVIPLIDENDIDIQSDFDISENKKVFRLTFKTKYEDLKDLMG